MSDFRLSIDHSALMHNIAWVQQRLQGRKWFAAVSLNAFGHGIDGVLPYLAGKASGYLVHSLAEANELRQHGVSDPIVLIGALSDPETIYQAAELDVGVTIADHRTLEWLLSAWLPNRLNIWLLVDVGCHLVGFDEAVLAAVISRLKNSNQVANLYLMAHLTMMDLGQAVIQMEMFEQISAPFAMPSSVVSSAMLLEPSALTGDVCRIGRAIYGLLPDAGLQPVMQVMGKLAAIKLVEAGEVLGRFSELHVEERIKIGIVNLPAKSDCIAIIRAFSRVYVNGSYANVLNLFDLGYLVVDLSGIPGCSVGDDVEFLGENTTANWVANPQVFSPLLLTALFNA